MKQGWEIKNLGDVCFVERGSSPRPIDKYFTDSSDGVNWIKIGDTKGVTKYIYSTKEKISIEGAKQSRFVKEGDFILSNSMSFGNPYIMKTQGYIHDGWFVLRLPDYIDSNYFYYLLSSPNIQKQMHSLASGAIVKNISGDLVKKVKVAYPPFTEQQRIVSILDEAFASISKAKANAAQNLKNAKELFESYLQNVFTNKVENWVTKSLIAVCDEITDGSHFSPKSSNEDDFPYVTVRDINEDIIDFENCKFISKANYELLLKNGCKPNSGDLLFSKDGTVGKVSLVDFNKDFVVLSSLAIIRPKRSIIFPPLLKYILKNPTFLQKAIGMKTGVAIRRIILKNLKLIEISFPESKLEQQSIVQKLEALSTETKKLETIYQQKLNDLEELKKAILQKAFNGELKTA
jgi:type I restriction enzyme, S subunit